MNEGFSVMLALFEALCGRRFYDNEREIREKEMFLSICSFVRIAVFFGAIDPVRL